MTATCPGPVDPAPLRRRALAAILAVAVLAGCSASGADGSASGPTTSRPAPIPTTEPAGSNPTTTSTTTPDEPAPDPSIDDVPDEVFTGQGDPRIDVSHYAVDVRADPGKAAIDGTAVITLSATTAGPLASFTLDLAGPEVRNATVDGARATVTAADEGEIELTPARPLRPHVDVDVVIDYGGDPDPAVFPRIGVPVGWQADDDGGWFTMSEPDGTSTWVPVSEHPSDKATWTITLDTPADAVGVSNGRLVSRDAKGGRRRWVWETDQPMASYLVFAAVGDYDLVERDGPGDTKALFAFAGGVDKDQRAAFDELDDIMAFYAQSFGGYPDDDTGAIVVAKDLRLALEVQTRPLFGQDALGGERVAPLAHELAHQWYGDAVTPRTWADLWLNESFASYADWLYRDDRGDADIRDLAEQARGASRLAVLEPEAAANFDPAIYDGGARALYALRLTVGDEDFTEILRRWFSEHDGSNVSTQDFFDLAEQVSGQDLSSFVDAWLRRPDQPDLPG